MGELLTLYGNGGDETELPYVRPFADYLGWLAEQNRDAARAAWREYLAGVGGPTRLAGTFTRDPTGGGQKRYEKYLSVELTTQLKELARDRGVTTNTVVQGMLAMLLGRLTGREDVVFGVTVSGRPTDLVGAERMIGLFINTLPLRVLLKPEENVGDLLARIQESQSRMLAYQYIGLTEIKQLAGVEELFDTLTVFENYGSAQATPRTTSDQITPDENDLTAGFRVSSGGSQYATHYPLSIAMHPGEQMYFHLHYDSAQLDDDYIETIVTWFERLIETAVAMPDEKLYRLGVMSDA